MKNFYSEKRCCFNEWNHNGQRGTPNFPTILLSVSKYADLLHLDHTIPVVNDFTKSNSKFFTMLEWAKKYHKIYFSECLKNNEDELINMLIAFLKRRKENLLRQKRKERKKSIKRSSQVL